MKGYAVSTIVKLLACLIALVVVTYLIYRYVMGSPISKQECAAMTSTWCSQCQLVEWSGGKGMSDELKKCASKYPKEFEFRSNCNNACEYCKSYLPGVVCPP